jgi:hypothetical protein
MIKRITTVFLIFVVMAANFSQLCIYAGFSLNQKYIASSLCENRDKPWMHCNGKCYLMKKIKLAEEKEKSEERQNQKNSFQLAIVDPAINLDFTTNLIQVLLPHEIPFALSSYAASIFQPPKAA